MTRYRFENQYGGFGDDDGEYIINDRFTPAPWSNILANSQFGTLVTQSGASFTWYGNSSLFRLTTKVDDPILEDSGERLYLKNESDGSVWEPLCKTYKVSHSLGESVYYSEHDLKVAVSVFVPVGKSIKIIRIKIKNSQDTPVKYSATYYMRPVLGDLLEKTKNNLLASYDEANKAICLRNPKSGVFPDAFVYLGSSENNIEHTFNRTRFFGRNNDSIPDGLKQATIGGDDVCVNDLCAVLKANFDMDAKTEKTIYFYVSVNNGYSFKPKIIDINDAAIDAELVKVKKYWNELPAFKLETPNRALDIMMNKWLPYQILSSRIWGQLGFWQPSGAFGYRDQLQDYMALIWHKPSVVRGHILLAASRQYLDGNVQHWWQPPHGDGIRSMSSDAALWLVYVLNFYARITGDDSIFDEEVSFIGGEGAGYYRPSVLSTKASVFKHATMALDRVIEKTGSHGLPLILSGDWNDSLSNIGPHGKGESVWVAQFIYKIIKDFMPICEKYDKRRSRRYRKYLAKLKININITWDGNWYKRAYWDNGEAFGSINNQDCWIDSLVQSWGVIAGTSPKNRAVTSMNSVENYLINWHDGFVRLLRPSITELSMSDPGYIATYPPGTRENGGSYSHNAVWVAAAFAELGEGSKAMGVLDILNPILKTNSNSRVNKYRGEPYVMASDVYTEGASSGQAGWTWYTGSAADYYKTVIESILGIVINKNVVKFQPCIPSIWGTFKVTYRYGRSTYEFIYLNPNGVENGVHSVFHNGIAIKKLSLINDGSIHEVVINLG